MFITECNKRSLNVLMCDSLNPAVSLTRAITLVVHYSMHSEYTGYFIISSFNYGLFVQLYVLDHDDNNNKR